MFRSRKTQSALVETSHRLCHADRRRRQIARPANRRLVTTRQIVAGKFRRTRYGSAVQIATPRPPRARQRSLLPPRQNYFALFRLALTASITKVNRRMPQYRAAAVPDIPAGTGKELVV